MACDSLELLKFDLRILHDKEDKYLQTRLEAAKKAIQKEGIKIDDQDEEINLVIVDYASWLYKKRDQDIGLPRHLRYRMNNILISQKAKE